MLSPCCASARRCLLLRPAAIPLLLDPNESHNAHTSSLLPEVLPELGVASSALTANQLVLPEEAVERPEMDFCFSILPNT